MNLDPARRVMPTDHDKAVTMYEGTVRRLIREQIAAGAGRDMVTDELQTA